MSGHPQTCASDFLAVDEKGKREAFWSTEGDARLKGKHARQVFMREVAKWPGHFNSGSGHDPSR